MIGDGDKANLAEDLEKLTDQDISWEMSLKPSEIYLITQASNWLIFRKGHALALFNTAKATNELELKSTENLK